MKYSRLKKEENYKKILTIVILLIKDGFKSIIRKTPSKEPAELGPPDVDQINGKKFDKKRRAICSKEAWEKEAIFGESVGNQLRLLLRNN